MGLIHETTPSRHQRLRSTPPITISILRHLVFNMSPKSILSSLLLTLQCTITLALNPSCAPGGNFDLSYWDLQLPSGTTGHPTTISSSSLQGCNGYQNDRYFFTDSGDGTLVMKVPGSPSS